MELIMNHFYEQIQGWFDFEDLYSDVVKIFPEKSHFVEVGSWKGKSASFMAVEIHNSKKQIKFDCVDTWNGSVEHASYGEVLNSLYEEFTTNIQPIKHIINPIRKTSEEAAKDYKDGSLDFVFIDASHEYEDVKKDIKAWLPKVKSGGFLAGHDTDWASVLRAVHETLPEAKFTSKRCWIYKL
jgi:predicted O-methyltransferase YrrM